MFVVLVRFSCGNRQRNDFYLPGCSVWMFITVWRDLFYLRCMLDFKQTKQEKERKTQLSTEYTTSSKWRRSRTQHSLYR